MTTADPQQQKRKNRRLLIIVALVFILPPITAKLFLQMGWYEPGISNKGNLIENMQIAEADNDQLPETWQIAYRVPETCDEACAHGLYVLSQTWHALGRQNTRVTAMGIQAQDNVSNLPELPVNSTLRYYTLPDTHELLGELPDKSLFIIDPVGNVVMQYDGSDDRQHMIMQARDLLDDLQKLLKMSRVG